MKIQNLAIIFIIIILPVSLLLAAYNRMQIDTINLQIQYNRVLLTSVYDAIKAYQINTTNNPYSILNTSNKRDVEASIQSFVTSIATGLGVGGYRKSYVEPYIPAVLFTLYDGYYIYGPTRNYNEETGEYIYESILKPFNTYSVRYKKGTIDIIVSYTLDNYITVVGEINGEYVNKSGYLINSSINNEKETLKEILHIVGEEPSKEYTYIYLGGEKRYFDQDNNRWFLYQRGKKLYISNTFEKEDLNAKKYSDESKEFTSWVQDKLKSITIEDMYLWGEGYAKVKETYFLYGQKERIFDEISNNFEDEDSNFNVHKRDMIKISIQETLNSAIANYDSHSTLSYNFRMPILQDNEWDQITKNIAMCAFMQGLPMGFKIYNGYAIVNDTKNKNFVDKDLVYFINENEVDGNYHMIDCRALKDESLAGYRKIEFEASYIETKEERRSSLL